MDMSAVDLSRLQFAVTALYHFIFVPLTLGLSFLIAIMESVYVMTNRIIWREMTQFWGILFGINFAMGVATGVPLEFQFGTNWAYYSYYVGDIFGSLLAIEGLMAFFLEATLIGLFFFGWKRLSQVQHLMVTWFLAIGTNLSALWILVANAWMQNPVGSYFNFESMRMELQSFRDILFNPVAQSKFVHTVSAGYVAGAVFVMSISAFYLLRGRAVEFAKRSMVVAASFGLASALSVVVLGDESGYTATQHQHMKIAAIEAMWETEPAPASLVIWGIPDVKTMSTRYEFKIPWLLGLIATRSFDKEVPGIKQLVLKAEKRITQGLKAYEALQGLKKDRKNFELKEVLAAHIDDLGHAFLLKRYRPDIEKSTAQEIMQAAKDTIPNVPVLFWAFRIMVGLGLFFIAYFALAFYFSSKRQQDKHRWFLNLSLYSLPLPWIAIEAGWIVAEYGRQPWSIDGVLPTFLGASTLEANHVWATLTAFVLFYTILFVVDMYLMRKYIKLGPENTVTGDHNA